MARRDLVREHALTEMGWCVHCGAAPWQKVTEWLRAQGKTVPAEDTRLCRWRRRGELCPEPARRGYGCEDSEAIASRLLELARARAEALNRPAAEAATTKGEFDDGA